MLKYIWIGDAFQTIFPTATLRGLVVEIICICFISSNVKRYTFEDTKGR